MFVLLILAILLDAHQCRVGNQRLAAAAIQDTIFGKVEEPEPVPVFADETAAREHGAGFRQKSNPQKYTLADLGRMSVQGAPAQKTYYRPTNYDNVPTIGACPDVKCHLNLALVLDSSGSVGHQNFQTTLGFVKTLLEILAIKAADEGVTVCTGVVKYSTRVSVEVQPCCENTMCAIVNQFSQNKIRYSPGATNTNGALKVARQLLQSTSSYKKVAILITDGKSNVGGSPISFATQMREEDGIDIVALGVTEDVNESELRGISGFDLVTRIDFFDQFHELATLLLEANHLESEYELTSTFEGICKDDTSKFSNTCDSSSVEVESCVWGHWSVCVMRRGGNCAKIRTCKLDGNAVKQEEKACECREGEVAAVMKSEVDSKSWMRARIDHGRRMRGRH